MNCNEQEISIFRPFSLVQNVVEEIESKFQSHCSKGFDGDYSSKMQFQFTIRLFSRKKNPLRFLLSVLGSQKKEHLNSIFKVGETFLLQIE